MLDTLRAYADQLRDILASLEPPYNWIAAGSAVAVALILVVLVVKGLGSAKRKPKRPPAGNRRPVLSEPGFAEHPVTAPVAADDAAGSADIDKARLWVVKRESPSGEGRKLFEAGQEARDLEKLILGLKLWSQELYAADHRERDDSLWISYELIGDHACQAFQAFRDMRCLKLAFAAYDDALKSMSSDPDTALSRQRVQEKRDVIGEVVEARPTANA